MSSTEIVLMYHMTRTQWDILNENRTKTITNEKLTKNEVGRNWSKHVEKRQKWSSDTSEVVIKMVENGQIWSNLLTSKFVEKNVEISTNFD